MLTGFSSRRGGLCHAQEYSRSGRDMTDRFDTPHRVARGVWKS